jgi:DNA helicase-2/ATP-dependent DNA helicase PcrA
VKADRLLEGLSDAQRAAVSEPGAPLCILAGAGAGKTTVLARRIAHRVASGSADAAHVLALTFTRKAATELTARLAALGMRDRVTAGTFHGVAYAQLRQCWRDRRQAPPGLLDRKSRILARLVPERPQLAGTPVALLAGEIEWAQSRRIAPALYEAAVGAAGRRTPGPPSAIASLFARYQTEKRRCRLVDFDDLLSLSTEAIRSDPVFAAAQRWRWRHVFVDEFQDVNPLQFQLLGAWLGDNVDLCVVGDPNQAIYAWNGADPALLDRLADHWPAVRVVRLDANHRCSPQVVAAAAAVLGPAGSALHSTRPDGPATAVRAYASDRAEAEGVAAELRRARAQGLGWSQLSVLVRTNAQAAMFQEALRAARVPVRLAAGDALLDHPAVSTVLTGLRRSPARPFAMVVADIGELAAQAGAREPWPLRPIGSATPIADTPLADPAVDAGAVDPASPDGGTVEGDARRAALAALWALARSYGRLDDGATTDGFLSWLSAADDRAAPPDDAVDAVTICTFHRAKGLEWAAVWVAGLERGLVPIGHATSPDDVAEERRLLYVALTRAERELHCSWARTRHLGGRPVPREPSPWVDAISVAASGGTEPTTEPQEWRSRLAAARGRLGRRAPSPTPDPVGPAPDPAVLDRLVAWRARTARAASVPPFVLLHDATLAALAAARPLTMADLLAVPGVGGVKAARYGDALLTVMADRQVPA